MIWHERVPIYGGHLVICIAKNPVKQLDRAGIPSGDEDGDSDNWSGWVFECPFDNETGGPFARWVVVIHPDATINTIAHESFHLAHHVSRWYSLPIIQKADDEEAAAYLTGWAAELLLEKLAIYQRRHSAGK